MKRSLQDQVFSGGTILLAATPISRAAPRYLTTWEPAPEMGHAAVLI